MHVLCAALLLCILTGCAPRMESAAVLAQAQAVAVESVAPVVVQAREVTEYVAPPAPEAGCVVGKPGVDLIVRFEIISPAYYAKHLEPPIWPGGSSGVTWGIGYDGGHQTKQRILDDWHETTHAARLQTTAGVIGRPAKSLLPGLSDIRMPLSAASLVFADSTLPRYCDLTSRTFSDGWDGLPQNAKDALVATVYNRGAGMQGDRRREMRTIRDECVPDGDAQCVARELRSMTRIWAGTEVGNGLRARYEATAELAGGST